MSEDSPSARKGLMTSWPHHSRIVDLAVDSFITCNLCNRQTCIMCKTTYHPGLMHAENLEALRRRAEQVTERAKERAREEAATQTFLDRRTETCPSQAC